MTVSAVGGVSASQVLDQAATRPDALNHLADQFSRMVQQQPAPQVPNETQTGSHSVVSHFIQAQEGVMRQTFDKVRAFSLQAPAMNPSELASHQIELTYQLAMVQVQFNAGVYISQSSKSGLQTLMKNQ
jgi:type III secretion inner rod protein HrpB2